MKFHSFITTPSLFILLSFSGAANADDCNAEAEFLRSYPANNTPSKFKFKFRVESDDCDKYGCTGHVHYRIHYQDKDGDARESESKIESYRIREGDTSREITHETYPGRASSPIQVRDVDITEVTCSTP